MSDFVLPRFGDRSLEVRFADRQVAIYGTRKGLGELISLLTRLHDIKTEDGSAHIHVEDYEVLTNESLPLALVLIEDSMLP